MANGAPILCPYCGHLQPSRHQCAACGGLLDLLSQKATQIDMGPWFIRDAKQPYRPGCSYEVIQRLAKAGRIEGNTILRGPTTYQYWTLARRIPGVAHLVGFCHRCSARVNPTEARCTSCGVVFVSPVSLDQGRNDLGLLYPTAESVAQARLEVDQQRQVLQAASPLSDAQEQEMIENPTPSFQAEMPGDSSNGSLVKQDDFQGLGLGGDLLRDVLHGTSVVGSPAAASSASAGQAESLTPATESGMKKLMAMASASQPDASAAQAFPYSPLPVTVKDPTAPLPSAAGSSSRWTIILVVLLNLLLLGVVVAVGMMLQNHTTP